MFKLTATVLAAAFAFTGVSQAAGVYSFEMNRQGNKMVDHNGDRVSAGIRDRAGKIYHASGSYDSDNQHLSWSTTIGKKGWSSFDGFWLVLNSGGNPKSLAQEGKLGILYFDAWAEDITVYQYTGKGGYSYKNGQLLASSRVDDSFVKDLDIEMENDRKTASFTIDVAGINSALGGDWMGMQFDDEVGIWMHTFDHGKIRYRNDGSIKKWDFCYHGWLDTNGTPTHHTETVPTPTAAAAGMIGLGLLGARRRNRQAA